MNAHKIRANINTTHTNILAHTCYVNCINITITIDDI